MVAEVIPRDLVALLRWITMIRGQQDRSFIYLLSVAWPNDKFKYVAEAFEKGSDLKYELNLQSRKPGLCF